MRKFFTRVFLPIAAVWAVIRFLLDSWGYMQAIREAFENRGAIMTVLGSVLSSQWLPVGLFLFGVLVWFYIEVGRNWFHDSKKRESEAQFAKYGQVLSNLAEGKRQKASEERRRIPFNEERIGFLQFDKLEYNNSSFVAGEPFGVTAWFTNRGSFPVYDAQGFALLIYGPPSMEPDAIRLTREAVNRQRRSEDGNQVAVGGSIYYPTMVTMTQQQIDSVLSGRDRIYLVTFADWKSADGVQVSPGWEQCSWMEPPGSDHFNPYLIKWRMCSKSARHDVAGRAEFSPMRAILEGDEPDEYKFAIGIKNTGDSTATEMHCRGFVWDEHLKGDLRVIGDQLANDVSAGTYIECCFLARITKRNTPQHFVVLTVEYKPNPQSPATKQTFYFKFRGVKNGKFDRVLVIATKIEKDAIERRFAEELQRAGLKA